MIIARGSIEDVKETLAASPVHENALCINAQIIHIAAHVDTGDTCYAAGGKDSKFWRAAKRNQDPLSILIEGHRKIGAALLHRPQCLRFASAGVEYRDGPCARHVHN